MDALEGVTVIDFSAGIAAPYGTKLLADLGARVIKIEKPGGDPVRHTGPFLGNEPGIERSATFQFLNTNKESVVLDLKRPESREVVDRLLARASLVVVSSPPAVASQLGLDYAALQPRTAAPVVWVTNFGPDGPYRDFRLSDTVLYAMGGEMFGHGNAGREPLKLGGTSALLQCGAMSAIAALGAITAAEVHGVAQLVDLPLFDVQINSVDRRSSAILAYRFSGRVLARPAGTGAGLTGGVYQVADGYVEVTSTAGNYWARFAAMIGDPVLMEPRWNNPAVLANPASREEADPIIIPWMLSRTKAEVWEAARRVHALVAPLSTGKDLVDAPVFRERGLWTEIEHAVLGRLPMLARPYVLDKTPWRLRRPAPMLGEHSNSVLRELGYADGQVAALRASGAAS